MTEIAEQRKEQLVTRRLATKEEIHEFEAADLNEITGLRENDTFDEVSWADKRAGDMLFPSQMVREFKPPRE